MVRDSTESTDESAVEFPMPKQFIDSSFNSEIHLAWEGRAIGSVCLFFKLFSDAIAEFYREYGAAAPFNENHAVFQKQFPPVSQKN